MSEKDCDHKPLPADQVQHDIDKYGCHIILVEADDYLPSFAYTIGLYQRFIHPEIICFGLSLNVSQAILNDACALIESGAVLTTKILYEQFLENYPIQFLPVDKSYYSGYLGQANNYYGNTDYPAIQFVWPDKQHLFPWDTGFNPAWKFKQPLLDRNTDFKFFEERNVASFVTRYVLKGSPVLYVYHNRDGSWQFQGNDEYTVDDVKIVSLSEIAKMDPSVNELFHLPYGYKAWRSSVTDEWQWERNENDDEEDE